MSLISDIRENNYLQPNRQFTIRGDVEYIEKQTDFTKVILGVFNYYANDGKNDRVTIWFKGNPKKIADKAIKPKCNLLVIGDIVIKDDNIFFNGKIIEVFKTAQYLSDNNAVYVDSKDVTGNKAY